jgi:uncharacterized membrane protein YtjA (UPF0391 family)
LHLLHRRLPDRFLRWFRVSAPVALRTNLLEVARANNRVRTEGIEELKMLSGLAGRQRNKLIASCALSVIVTVLGLVPFVLVYLVMLELFKPVVDQAYIWNLVFWSVAAILLRFGFMGLSGTFSHIAAYSILYDLRIKLARTLKEYHRILISNSKVFTSVMANKKFLVTSILLSLKIR